MMKTIVTFEHDKSATDLCKVQDTGRVSVTKILEALSIPKHRWNRTMLQVTVFVIEQDDDDGAAP